MSKTNNINKIRPALIVAFFAFFGFPPGAGPHALERKGCNPGDIDADDIGCNQQKCTERQQQWQMQLIKRIQIFSFFLVSSSACVTAMAMIHR